MKLGFVLDFVFCVVIPIAVWHTVREAAGDYATMLLASVPAVAYSLARFYLTKRLHFTGVFILSSLIFGTLLDVLSGSAMMMLWNSVVYGFAMSGVYLVSIAVNRPIALYFALDVMEMRGYDRSEYLECFRRSDVRWIFHWITAMFAVRNATVALVSIWLIQAYGVDGYDKGLLVKQAVSWLLMGVVMIGYLYVNRRISSERYVLS